MALTTNTKSLDSVGAGEAMHRMMRRLFPICRSITGNGLRESLKIIQEHVPLTIHEVPSGTKVFDWTIPREWNIRDAYVLDPSGKRVIDFKESNLHVVGYSVPVDRWMNLDELQEHLYSLPAQPDAIPYITSYYNEHWGFCLSHRQRESLKEGKYRAVVDSTLQDGSLTYGELIIPGASKQEIFLSTYLCHPSMANNELSGPVVTAQITRWISSAPRRYTYRIIFIPETIGSLTYLSRNLEAMKRNVVAGFNVTCIGDDRAYSYLASRNGETLADRAAVCILRDAHPDFVRYTYLDRGSDERQYCSPGVDLPVASVMRSKYRAFPEYHTSLDDLEFVTPEGLSGGYAVLRDCLELLERNKVYRGTCLGEPQLGRRGLYPTVNTKETFDAVSDVINFLAYADGTSDLIDISMRIGVPVRRIYSVVEKLVAAGLLVEVASD